MSERKATRTAVVRTPQGFHLRPWGEFVKLAEKFQAQVVVTRGGTQAGGSSPMDLMTLAATMGSQLKIEAEGPDAEEAVSTLCEFIENYFEDIESSKQNSSS